MAALAAAVGLRSPASMTAPAGEAATVSADLAQRIYARSEGNAFFTRQLARALAEQGRLNDALAAYRGGLAIQQRLVAETAANAQWQRDLSGSYDGIGDALMTQGKSDEADDSQTK